MYAVNTIGDLLGPWPEIPPGWVPRGTPQIPGMPAPPVPVEPPPPSSGIGSAVVGVAAGLAVAGLGVWLLSKRKGRR